MQQTNKYFIQSKNTPSGEQEAQQPHPQQVQQHFHHTIQTPYSQPAWNGTQQPIQQPLVPQPPMQYKPFPDTQNSEETMV